MIYLIILDAVSKEGSASNVSNEVVEAVSYGLAKEMKVDDFYIQNSKDYKPPQYVERLPPKTPIPSGEAITVDEVIIKHKFDCLNFKSYLNKRSELLSSYNFKRKFSIFSINNTIQG